MKKIYSRTINAGRCSATLLPGEFIFIVNGKKTRIFTVRKPVVRLNRMLFIVTLWAIAAAVTIFLVFPFEKDSLSEDDAEKNNLLQSKSTDFSSPVGTRELHIVFHTVKRGETLSAIAQKYGVSMDTICGTNNLRSYDLINEGITLKIPNKDGILYKMNSGGDIVSLSKKYKIPVNRILSENSIKNPDFVPVGSFIFIPDARPQNIVSGFMWPAATRIITCGYGWRRSPFSGGGKEFHQGLDIRSNYSWVRSSKYGKVTYTGWLGGYGKTIIIAHPGGWKTLYAHLSRIIVNRNQYVRQGQTIGRSGNTGRSTGPHLHFEVIKSGRHKNPYYYLKKL